MTVANLAVNHQPSADRPAQFRYGIVFLLRYLQGLAGIAQVPFLAGLIVTGLGLVIGAGMIHQHFRSAARAAAEPTTVS